MRLICTNLCRDIQKRVDCSGSETNLHFLGRTLDDLPCRELSLLVVLRSLFAFAGSSLQSPWLELQKSNVTIGSKTGLAPSAIGSFFGWYTFAFLRVDWAQKFVKLLVGHLVDDASGSPPVGVVRCLLISVVAACEDVKIAWQCAWSDAGALKSFGGVCVSPPSEPWALAMEFDDRTDESAI